MSRLLTDRAAETVDTIEVWIIVAIYVFLAYALAQHVGWLDGAAIVLAFNRFVVAIRSRNTI